MGFPPAPKEGQKISTYGHTFTWTKLHKSPEELNKYIYTYDTLATEALDQIEKVSPPTGNPYGRDFFKLLQDHASEGGRVAELWEEVNTVPDWVDWDQIDRGQKVFWRYIGPALTTLGQLSLLGSFAYDRAVKVLDKTGGWKTENIKRRLLETTQHTLDVHRDLKSLQPGGDGWESSVRVRLLHSSVRRRMLSLMGESKSYYDGAVDGVPINDMDSMITMNDFSSLLVYLGLPRQGIHASAQETADYLAVWRYICYIMGTPNWFLESPAQARAMMDSIFYAHVKPVPESGRISNNMINGLVGHAPAYSSRGFLVASAYWLNGPQIASALDLEKPSLYYTTLVAGQCWLFIVLTWTKRMLPFLDNVINEAAKKNIYEALVHNKEKGGLGYKAKFSFKWIPMLGFKTPHGETEADLAKNAGTFKHFGTEAISLATILMTIASTAGGIYGAASLMQKYGGVHGIASLVRGVDWGMVRNWDMGAVRSWVGK